MSTMIPLEKELPRFEAVALIHEERPPEPNLMREEAGNNAVDNAFPLEEARRLARSILQLDGLTGAEIEAAERVLSVDRADIRRLREIAGNHAMLIPEFFNLNASGARAQEGRTSGIQR
jgi:chorismate-pyruvate lyase